MIQPDAILEARSEALAASGGDLLSAMAALTTQVERYRIDLDYAACAAGRRGSGAAKVAWKIKDVAGKAKWDGLTEHATELLRMLWAKARVTKADFPDIERYICHIRAALFYVAPEIEIETLRNGQGYALVRGFDAVKRLLFPDALTPARPADLTDREVELVRLFAERGAASTELVRALARHVSNIRPKLAPLGVAIATEGNGVYAVAKKDRAKLKKLLAGGLESAAPKKLKIKGYAPSELRVHDAEIARISARAKAAYDAGDKALSKSLRAEQKLLEQAQERRYVCTAHAAAEMLACLFGCEKDEVTGKRNSNRLRIVRYVLNSYMSDLGCSINTLSKIECNDRNQPGDDVNAMDLWIAGDETRYAHPRIEAMMSDITAYLDHGLAVGIEEFLDLGLAEVEGDIDAKKRAEKAKADEEARQAAEADARRQEQALKEAKKSKHAREAESIVARIEARRKAETAERARKLLQKLIEIGEAPEAKKPQREAAAMARLAMEELASGAPSKKAIKYMKELTGFQVAA